jgi:hypothetical protein
VGVPAKSPPPTRAKVLEGVGRIKRNTVRKLAGTKTRADPTRPTDPLADPPSAITRALTRRTALTLRRFRFVLAHRIV